MGTVQFGLVSGEDGVLGLSQASLTHAAWVGLVNALIGPSFPSLMWTT